MGKIGEGDDENGAQPIEKIYCATVVSCHNCIQPLDVLTLVESTNIQRPDATVSRYHNCTTDFRNNTK